MSFKKSKIIVAAALVLCVLLSGCGYNPESVGTINGEDIPCGRWLYYQFNALHTLAGEYNDAHPDDQLSSYLDLLSKTDDDGTSYTELLREETLKACKRYVFVESEFDRLGLEITEDEQSSNENTALSIWNYYGQTIYESNGVGYDTFLQLYENGIKDSMVMSALYGEGGEREITLEEREEYFYNNFMAAEYFTLPSTVEDEEGSTQNISDLYPDELDALAQEMVETAKQSGLRAAYLSHYAEALALAGDTETAVDSDAADSAIHTGTYSEVLGYNTDMTDAVAAIEEDDYGYALIGSTMYIFQRTALTSDAESDYDETVISLLSEEPFEEYVTEQTASYEVTTDDKALNYYSAEKVDLSYLG